MDIKLNDVAIVLGSNGGLRDMMRANLKSMGYFVLESTPSAQLALERLSDENTVCNLIISEVSLDGMSCRNFLAELRTMPDFDSAMVILLASEHEYEQLEGCLEFGIAGVIKKPFNNDAFPALLKAPFQRLKYLNGNHKALFLSTFSAFCDSQSRFKAAIRYMEESIRLAESAISHFELGRLYLRVKNPQKADQHFKKAVDLNPTFKAPADKSLMQFKLENPSDDAALASATNAFLLPLRQFGNSFHAAHRLKKAMVVGGNHNDRVGIKNFLGNLGVKNVAMHENPDSALKILRDCDVSLVVTWLRFAKSDSLSLTRVLREIYSNRELKILIIVEANQTRDLAQVMEAGADGYFIPPFIAENFCQRLHRCMVVHDLTAKCGPATALAKAAYTMFETENHQLGEKYAEQALALAPENAICKLFLAMNRHLLLKKESAYALYDDVEQNTPSLAHVSARVREELELAAAEMEKKLAPKEVKPAVSEAKKPAPAGGNANPSPNPDATGAEDDFGLPPQDEAKSVAPEPPKKKKRRVVEEGELTVIDKIAEEEVKLGAAAIVKSEADAPPSAARRRSAPPPQPSAPPSPPDSPAAPEQTLPPEAPPPPPAADKKHEIVRRRRLRLKKESMAHFTSLAQLQKEVFGKVEPVVAEVGIPRSMFDQGVSEVDLVQPLGIEPVFGGSPKEPPAADFGKVLLVEQSVVPWLPTETLEAMNFAQKANAAQNPETGGGTDGVSEAFPTSASSVIQITEQAQLLNSRIICLPDKSIGSQCFFDYVRNLGKVVAEKDLVGTFGLEKSLDAETRSLLEEVRNDSGDTEKNTRLGTAMVSNSIADEIFQGMSNGLNDENMRKLAEETLAELKAPIVNFHRECLNGKKEFERLLPAVLESIENGEVDFSMLYKAMDQDHNSFESFKKVYQALARAHKKEELEMFFNAKYRNYTENEKSAKALQRFLLAMGDSRRLKQLEPKPSVDEMKRMALDWYQKNELDKAVTLCRRLVTRKAHLEFAFNLMGVVYRKMGKLQDAIDSYAKGIEVEPGSVKLHHNISIAYSLAGDEEKARDAAQKARSLKEAHAEGSEKS